MSGLRFWKGDEVTKLDNNQIFVYDSNPQGMHGVGSGLQARKFGAKLGMGRGLHGKTLTTFKNTYLLKNNKKNTPNY